MISSIDIRKNPIFVVCACIVAVIFCLLFIFVVPNNENNSGDFSDHLSLVENINGEVKRCYYVDSMGSVTFAIDKHYAVIEQHLDEFGRSIEDFYFDENNNPVKQPAGNYGLRHFYNDLNQDILIEYLDVNGNSLINTSGYVFAIRSFNNAGQVLTEMYYDGDKRLTTASMGESGVMYQYDSSGRRYLITYLSKEGIPIRNKMGYTSLLRIYRDDGVIDTEYYLDSKGNKIAISNGYYGRKYIGNYTFFVNSDGSVVLNINSIIDNFPWIMILFGIFIAIALVVFPFRYRLPLFIIYCLFMVRETVLFRQSSVVGSTGLFWSYSLFFENYQLRMEIIKNIMLFIPFGSFWCSVSYKKRAIIISVIASVLIELIQLLWNIGYFEVDDILSNSLGGCIGWLIAYCILSINHLNNDKSLFS